MTVITITRDYRRRVEDLVDAGPCWVRFFFVGVVEVVMAT